MTSGIQSYLELLRRPVSEPSMEPELDDIDEKADALMREQTALASGAIRKSILQQGHGAETPEPGDMVLFHLSLKKEDGDILQTSRPDEGGNGVPKAFVLGKGKRLPRGWELAIEDMLKGERAAFKIAPELSFGEKDCKIGPPRGVSAEANLVIDMQLVYWYKKAEVKAIGEDGVILRMLSSSESWEHPRPPFEVVVSLKARVPSSSGEQGRGIPYFSTVSPLVWAMGSGRVGKYLEEGLGSMAKAEKAILSCPIEAGKPKDQLLPPAPDGIDRVEFEVELHSMIQVRDMTGTGDVVKRRLKEGEGQFPIDCPLEDNAVKVHYKAYSLKTKEVYYDSRGLDRASPPLEFDTGINAVPEAVDMCVRLMTPGEVAAVEATPKFGYESRRDKPDGCPKDETIGFEIELVSFSKTPHWHSMTAQDKIMQAERVRTQGNVAFKLDQLGMARQKYLKGMKLLDNAYDAETDEQIAAISSAKASCLVNLATVSQREGNYNECFSWCDKALREQPSHPKAHYRKGVAHRLLGNYDEAKESFIQAKEADPSIASDMDREILQTKRQVKATNLKEKQDLSAFFDRKIQPRQQ